MGTTDNPASGNELLERPDEFLGDLVDPVNLDAKLLQLGQTFRFWSAADEGLRVTLSTMRQSGYKVRDLAAACGIKPREMTALLRGFNIQ